MLAVEAKDITVRYGQRTILDAISFSLEAGRFLAILGPNGAGKSTLLKCLMGLAPWGGGEIRLLGESPKAITASRIGYVPQIKSLDRRFPAEAQELVVTGLLGHWPKRITSNDRQQAEAAMERCGVLHLARQAIGRLSGGELQRVYLARSLVRRPELILLDEPATGLDITGEADLYRILDRYQQDRGATVVMVTHDMLVASHHADDVLMINGRVVSFGPAQEALSEDTLSQAFGHVGHHHALGIFNNQGMGTKCCGHDHDHQEEGADDA